MPPNNLFTVAQGNSKGRRSSKSSTSHASCRKGTREYLAEYCNNTSLHGLKYVGGENRTIYEKIIWCILFSTSVICCWTMISKTYQKWITTPVIVSFSENPSPVYKVPFPAITICPQNPCKQTARNFTDLFVRGQYSNISDEEKEIFNRLTIVCDFEEVGGNKTFEEDDILDLFEYTAPTIDDTFIDVDWNGEDVANFPKFFTRKLTQDGICYSFNILSSEEMFTKDMYFPDGFLKNNETKSSGWAIETGYQNSDIRNSYPKRVTSGGVSSGLTLSLKVQEEDLDYVCKSPTQGFKIMIHAPGDVTRGLTQYVIAPIDNEVNIAVTPSEMTTSDKLESYKPKDRRCYFPSEKKLQFFQIYSFTNCQMECLTNYTVSRCGCVKFFMPRTKGTKLCGSGSFQCARDVEHALLEGKLQDGGSASGLTPCDCMPSCFSLQYGAESSQAVFHWRQFFRSLGKYEKAIEEVYDIRNTTHVTRVSIFFKDNDFLPVQRGELYGGTDFLANCGGIFGLFTGFSILSLMEIIYYLTVRMWINKCKHGKCCMSTPEEDVEEYVNGKAE